MEKAMEALTRAVGIYPYKASGRFMLEIDSPMEAEHFQDKVMIEISEGDYKAIKEGLEK